MVWFSINIIFPVNYQQFLLQMEGKEQCAKEAVKPQT